MCLLTKAFTVANGGESVYVCVRAHVCMRACVSHTHTHTHTHTHSHPLTQREREREKRLETGDRRQETGDRHSDTERDHEGFSAFSHPTCIADVCCVSLVALGAAGGGTQRPPPRTMHVVAVFDAGAVEEGRGGHGKHSIL